MLEATSFLLAVLAIVLLVLLVRSRAQVRRMSLELSRLRTELESTVERRARDLMEEWRRRELGVLTENLRRAAEEEARAKLQQWVSENEERIRRDAIERSYATLLGRIGEQLAPVVLMANHGINPRDLRFIGTPVDFVAFNGLSEGNPREVVFVEVKSGRSGQLTERERAVRRLVEEGRVRWLTLHMQSELSRALAGSSGAGKGGGGLVTCSRCGSLTPSEGSFCVSCGARVG